MPERGQKEPPLAILGVGLIGGSFGLGLKACGYTGLIRGWDRPEPAQRALARGAIDQVAADLPSACRGAALVLLALPIGAILDLLPQVLAAAEAEALVTDTGSTKRHILERARQATPDEGTAAAFLGGHPLAGRAIGGVENSAAHLFQGATWLLVGDDRRRDEDRTNFFEGLLRRLGARPQWAEAAVHDAIVARLSHLPQLLSTALGADLSHEFARHRSWGDLPTAAGPGVRDMLRLAASPYALWRDILLTNSDEIDAALEQLHEELDSLRQHLRHRELEEIFSVAAETARQIRGE